VDEPSSVKDAVEDYTIEYTTQGESELLQSFATDTKSNVVAEFKQIFERFEYQVKKMQ